MVSQEYVGEVVRKVKHSSVRIENPLLALYRGYGVFQSREDFSDSLEGVPRETIDIEHMI